MKRDYISRLSFLARWRFSPEEAEDIISDYREMIANEPGTDTELVQRFGTPWAALRQIPSAGISRTWLAGFALSCVCVLAPAAWALWFNVNQVMLRMVIVYQWNVPSFLLTDRLGEVIFSPLAPTLMLVLGLAAPLLWFRHRCKEKQPLTRAMLLTMIMLLALLAGLWCIILKIECDFDGFVQLLAPCSASVKTWTVIRGVCFGVPTAAAAVSGTAGLILSRAKNRRWRAVYALALLLAVLCAGFMHELHSMALDGGDGWRIFNLRYYMMLTIIGLFGTGVSLC